MSAFVIVALAALGFAAALVYAIRWDDRHRRPTLEEHLRRITADLQQSATVMALAFTPALRKAVEAFEDFAKSMQKMQETLKP
jgi:Flp pilus assembly protein TadB